MQQTHQLLDSIERKVQNCVIRDQQYEKLLFSGRPSHIENTIDKQQKQLGDSKITLLDHHYQKKFEKMGQRLENLEKEKEVKVQISREQQTSDFEQEEARSIVNLNRTIKLYSQQITSLQEQMKRMQMNYQKQIQDLQIQLRKYQL
ncbi:unnamed protein product [Paramecium primaurelia]|uniref:Uncharacterized protein n=2 Tax=Paramecium TaxID=5884 RepID=A0A8S1Y1I0_9CILI|nr:unnamed protein product [Paramecium primaurelia]CAD8207633.1 unnamed protein product [Paramecium pentaurelia]